MYEYKFKKVYLKTQMGWEVPLDEYQDIIHQHAADGWRFVQIFAPSLKNTGQSSYLEIIFEREKGA